MYGFLLISHNEVIEFYNPEKPIILQWIEALKLFVVMLDLKEDYIISKQLGRGNFARVHLCHLVDDANQFFALKTMDKTAIKKNRRSIVSLILLNLLGLRAEWNRCPEKDGPPQCHLAVCCLRDLQVRAFGVALSGGWRAFWANQK